MGQTIPTGVLCHPQDDAVPEFDSATTTGHIGGIVPVNRTQRRNRSYCEPFSVCGTTGISLPQTTTLCGKLPDDAGDGIPFVGGRRSSMSPQSQAQADLGLSQSPASAIPARSHSILETSSPLPLVGTTIITPRNGRDVARQRRSQSNEDVNATIGKFVRRRVTYGVSLLDSTLESPSEAGGIHDDAGTPRRLSTTPSSLNHYLPPTHDMLHRVRNDLMPEHTSPHLEPVVISCAPAELAALSQKK